MNSLFILLEVDPWFLGDLTELIAAVLIFGLPILIAAFIYRHKMNETNKRAEIVLKALEKNPDEVPEELLKSLNTPQKPLKERLLGKLLCGLALTIVGVAIVVIEFATHLSTNEWFSDDRNLMVLGAALFAVGVAFLIYFFVARRTMQHEIEAEEHEAEMRKNVV